MCFWNFCEREVCYEHYYQYFNMFSFFKFKFCATEPKAIISMFRFYNQCSGEFAAARIHCEGGGGFCWGWFCFPSNFKIKLKLFCRWTCCCLSPLWGWSWFDSLPTPRFPPNRSRLSFFLLANLFYRPLSTQQIQVEFFLIGQFFDLPICQFAFNPTDAGLHL